MILIKNVEHILESYKNGIITKPDAISKVVALYETLQGGKLLKEGLPIEPQQKYNVAFVIGHTDGQSLVKDKGAYSEILEMYENAFWFEQATKYLSSLGPVIKHDGLLKSYTERQRDTAERTAKYDLVFELHFNSSDQHTARGCEAIVLDNKKKAYDTAEYFVHQVRDILHITPRFTPVIEVFKNTQNGFGFVNYTKGTAILLEPFFGDNVEDVNKFDGQKFREVILNTIKKFYGLQEN